MRAKRTAGIHFIGREEGSVFQAHWCLRIGANGCPSWSNRVHSPCLSLCFIGVLIVLDDAYVHCWAWPYLCSLLIQILTSSRNSLIDTPRSVLPALWAFLSPVKSTHKVNHHRGTVEGTLAGLAPREYWVSHQGLWALSQDLWQLFKQWDNGVRFAFGEDHCTGQTPFGLKTVTNFVEQWPFWNHSLAVSPSPCLSTPNPCPVRPWLELCGPMCLTWLLI